jgi:hypothetical protein
MHLSLGPGRWSVGCTSHPSAEPPGLGVHHPTSDPIVQPRRGMAEQAQSPHSTANCFLLGLAMWTHWYPVTQPVDIRPGPLILGCLTPKTGEVALAVTRTAHFFILLLSCFPALRTSYKSHPLPFSKPHISIHKTSQITAPAVKVSHRTIPSRRRFNCPCYR